MTNIKPKMEYWYHILTILEKLYLSLFQDVSIRKNVGEGRAAIILQ